MHQFMYFLCFFFIFSIASCKEKPLQRISHIEVISEQPKGLAVDTTRIKLGIEQTERYLPLLQNKKVVVVGNQTSTFQIVNKSAKDTAYVHLVDSLLAQNVAIQKVFAPEHGFRGKADAGETVLDGKDTKNRASYHLSVRKEQKTIERNA